MLRLGDTGALDIQLEPETDDGDLRAWKSGSVSSGVEFGKRHDLAATSNGHRVSRGMMPLWLWDLNVLPLRPPGTGTPVPPSISARMMFSVGITICRLRCDTVIPATDEPGRFMRRHDYSFYCLYRFSSVPILSAQSISSECINSGIVPVKCDPVSPSASISRLHLLVKWPYGPLPCHALPCLAMPRPTAPCPAAPNQNMRTHC